ncbi:MAG: alpha/beta hydrolase fold domain-containing protein, partial [Candidatus Puniceispirillaceae bacterium]
MEEVSIIRDRQMNYQTYLDEHIWQFIRDTARHFPDDAAQLSIAEQRRVYDSMCHAFAVERPCHLRVVDGKAGAVGLRHYSAGDGDACIVYFHGGGFVMGGLDSHDDVCAEICAATGYDVIAVDYRLAPENPFPAAIEDAEAAYDWLLEQGVTPEKMFVAGD